MARRREIRFSIDDAGNVAIEVQGAVGDECETMTRDIEEALGIVSSRERTSSYYQSQNTSLDDTVSAGQGGEG